MNRHQWFVSSIGLIIFGSFLLRMASPACFSLEGDLLVSCFIRRYAYAIPGLISLGLGILFVLLGWLEFKKK